VPAHLRGAPVDYESLLGSSVVSRAAAKDRLRKVVLEVPADDWAIRKQSRAFRTVDIPVPPTVWSEGAPAQLRECATAYVCDTVVVERKYAGITQPTPATSVALADANGLTSYEIDLNADSSGRGRTPSIDMANRQSTVSRQMTETETPESLMAGTKLQCISQFIPDFFCVCVCVSFLSLCRLSTLCLSLFLWRSCLFRFTFSLGDVVMLNAQHFVAKVATFF
jgi:hypothetical protein